MTAAPRALGVRQLEQVGDLAHVPRAHEPLLEVALQRRLHLRPQLGRALDAGELPLEVGDALELGGERAVAAQVETVFRRVFSE